MVVYNAKLGRFTIGGKLTKVSDLSLNSKIRAMLDSGMERRVVAKQLGVRYQRVRNVQVAATSKLAGRAIVADGFWSA